MKTTTTLSLLATALLIGGATRAQAETTTSDIQERNASPFDPPTEKGPDGRVVPEARDRDSVSSQPVTPLGMPPLANTTVFSSTQQDGCTLTGCYTISANGYTGFPQKGASSLVRLVMDQQLSPGMDQFRYPANSNTFYNVFWIMDSTGAKHQLGYDNSNTALLRATDGTGYLFVPGSTTPYSPWAGPGGGTIYTSGGIKYAAGSITDPDGNSILLGSPNLTDTLGRSFPFGPGTSTSTNGKEGQLTIAGIEENVVIPTPEGPVPTPVTSGFAISVSSDAFWGALLEMFLPEKPPATLPQKPAPQPGPPAPPTPNPPSTGCAYASPTSCFI